MRRLRLSPIAILVATLACGNPLGSSAAGSFVWTVNGQEIQASSNGFAALQTGGTINLTGTNCGSGAHLQLLLFGTLAPGGTYGPANFTASYAPDTRTSGAASISWEVFSGNGSGSVMISALSSSRISGSLDLVLAAGPGNPGGGPLPVRGTFDVPIQDRTVC